MSACIQVENEYKNVEAAFHEKGPSYVRWAALMAVNLQTGVPWVMCKQDDAPDPVVSSLVLQCLAFSNCCFKGNPPFSGLEDVQSACRPPSSVLFGPANQDRKGLNRVTSFQMPCIKSL
jgi:hypothetical protein